MLPSLAVCLKGMNWVMKKRTVFPENPWWGIAPSTPIDVPLAFSVL